MTPQDPADRSGPDGDDDAATPAWESLDEGDRIDDAQWSDIVSGIRADHGFVPEISADEVREALEESEDWHPRDPGPVGWRTASPLFILGITGLLGGIIALIVSSVVFRSLPGYGLLIILAVILISGGILIRHLPERRPPDSGDGAQV